MKVRSGPAFCEVGYALGVSKRKLLSAEPLADCRKHIAKTHSFLVNQDVPGFWAVVETIAYTMRIRHPEQVCA